MESYRFRLRVGVGVTALTASLLIGGCANLAQVAEQVTDQVRNSSLPGQLGLPRTQDKPGPRPRSGTVLANQGPRPGQDPMAAEAAEREATRAAVIAPIPSIPANAPRRYELSLRKLMDTKEGGEILELPKSRTSREGGELLVVLRDVKNGFRTESKWVPLPSLGSSPAYLHCHYETWDRSNPKKNQYIFATVKFWHLKRPTMPSLDRKPINAQGQELINDMIDLNLADVALSQCPNTWGEALRSAVGDQVMAGIKTRPMPSDGRRASAAVSTNQHPQTPIQRCDSLAAHPDDPEAFSAGVPDGKLDAPAIISACEEAKKLDPNSPRLDFQLARGYLKAERLQDAVERLIAASRLGHGASLAYLGDIQLDGGPGIEPDPVLARSLYTRALQAGFQPAKDILEEFEDFTDRVAEAEMEEKTGIKNSDSGKPRLPFVPKRTAYKVPGVMDNILRGDLNSVAHTEIWSKYFLVEVASVIGHYCQTDYSNDKIASLRTTAAISNIDRTSAGGIAMLINAGEDMATLLANPRVAASRNEREAEEGEKIDLDRSEEAAHDGIVLLSRYKCDGAEIKTFSRNAEAFIRGDGAPPLDTERVWQSCNASSASQNNRNRQFCHCVTRKMLTARVTRAERLELTTNFISAFNSIQKKQDGHFYSCWTP